MNAEFDITGIVLETERLILREWKTSDLEDFFEYASVEGVGEMAGWSHHKSIMESQMILNSFINNRKTFAIVYKENNKVIGSIGIEFYGSVEKLTEFARLKGREIGYVLSKDYWGKGLMTEAIKCVTDYLFNVLDYDFLLCGYFDFNTRSARVQEKCGFVPYRRLNFDTRTGSKETGVLQLLLNPAKDIKLVFSHPETLIYEEG
ncbi:MAG: GNAT family N-acetyltransferase [Erysipelotrichaceae bacterium]|nr:GNAT family N-acetyltransferase [Erysipelotrichaceae bacterium]MBE6125589.1 GNAT family N-acetyltransferase [Erysipelotrichaceae bacterium]